MKNVLKISIFALMILCSAMVYSQTADNSDQILQKINEALSQGDCDHAQKRYNVWKTFADTTDASVESRIAECVKGEKKRQEAGLLMQQINESLSQSDCDDAQLYYNVWKTSSSVSDAAVESRIAECVKAKEKSQQNTATMPNQIQQTAEPEMVFVQGGTFTMGCTSEQGNDCWNEEKPAHPVTLKNFYIGKYEITQAQWKAVMDKNPSKFKGDNFPVEQVSWKSVQEFIRVLNIMTGKHYRLPTEAEWEFAARGGNKSQSYKYSGSNNLNDVAWYKDNSEKTTHPVGTKLPNELGIFDMSGNVMEWCNDPHDLGNNYTRTEIKTNSRVVRGGNWKSEARNLRVSNRDASGVYTNDGKGFRLACSSE